MTEKYKVKLYVDSWIPLKQNIYRTSLDNPDWIRKHVKGWIRDYAKSIKRGVFSYKEGILQSIGGLKYLRNNNL